MNPLLPRILLTALFATVSSPFLNAAHGQGTTPERRPAPARPAPTRPGEAREPIAEQLPDARFKVGDRVVLRLTLSDRSEFNLAQQRGKLVLLDFWMSTDPGKAHVAELLTLQAKYADKGLVVVGLSGDHQLSDAETTVREMGITWPIHWDGYWRENKVFAMFGVPALPRVAIIGPDGTLLYFGRGSKMAAEVDKAFLNHPPFAKDQLALAIDALKEADRAMNDGDVLAGYRAYAALPPESRNDPVVTKKANDLRYRLVHSSTAAFKAVDDLIAADEYVEASASLTAIAKALGSTSVTPAQAEATRRLDALLARPEVKEKVVKAEREAAAMTALDAARKLRDAGSDIAAYERYRAVTMDYPRNTRCRRCPDRHFRLRRRPHLRPQAEGRSGWPTGLTDVADRAELPACAPRSGPSAASGNH
jgi:peroxiredoxin